MWKYLDNVQEVGADREMEKSEKQKETSLSQVYEYCIL